MERCVLGNLCGMTGEREVGSGKWFGLVGGFRYRGAPRHTAGGSGFGQAERRGLELVWAAIKIASPKAKRQSAERLTYGRVYEKRQNVPRGTFCPGG